jgi:glycerol kinase
VHEADDLPFDTIEPWIAYVSPESPFSSRTPAIDGLDRICMSTSQHISELTNALRTLLLNVRTLEWDPIFLRFFGSR